MWKVLLVEDEIFVRESVREIIKWEEMGFTVIGEAGNGEEALDIILSNRPHLVITDIIMPKMDGVTLLKRTREAGLDTKFVMLTCMSEFEYVRQAMEYGASNYILKLSMNVQSLRDTLGKVGAELSRSRDLQEHQGAKETKEAKEAKEVPSSEPAATASDHQVPAADSVAAADAEPMPSVIDATRHPEVKKILQYIEENYAQDITVKSLSQYVMMGENYVSALFKKKTGQTIIHYLHQVRVEKAAYHLIHTDLPVSEIGHRVGFSNDNYFIKIFKRLKQSTPSRFRQLHRR
ncbi:response regulator [Paenibacillus hexagrammi]|uniref:Response regulator n=1 Tax=Paenibacillus hexagrammi TaxID=2908839 RepID=A0ABY3SDJ5_9BACL|nr:response regulator [Paenibacillus sp. YPD9-1]UJF32062.1 response regulator [Paenibacillus sp. YPD9-1]